MKWLYVGIDVGSVSTNVAAVDERGEVVGDVYLLTRGRPMEAVKEGLRELKEQLGGASDVRIGGAGTTGSGRQLAAAMVGADVVKNEITAHAVAALHFQPDASTIIEIGGQDSKVIILRHGVVVDFAMNTVCAAGTGSFLDRQAARLGVEIEKFGDMALKSEKPVRIAGRCAVFAESDMIHKQQIGHRVEDIVRGLCQALVRNFLNNVAKGKEMKPPIVFQGGVAANAGMKRAFEEALGTPVIVPAYHKVMGAVGAALLAKDAVARKGFTRFRGFEVADADYRASGFECDRCANRCEIVCIYMTDKLIARWGSRCGRWEVVEDSHAAEEGGLAI